MADGATDINGGSLDGGQPVVTDAAFDQLATILQAEGAAGRAAGALRVSVLGGGCSGFQYRFELIDAPESDDLTLDREGVRVAIDPVSLPLLAGSVIDYKREMIGSRFAVENPQASSTCGCGTSFSI